MKHRSLLICGVLALIFTGCYPVRTVTVTPVAPVSSSYNYNYGYNSSYGADLCLNLDLKAMAAAFAQSSSAREFEILLNDSGRFISNLDLNMDGYVDYLRVMESMQYGVHVFLVQAVLGYNSFQDVASIVVENPLYSSWRIEIVGNPYIYGPNYIVTPVFRNRPCILAHFSSRYYEPWASPWRWGYYPDRYKHQPPIVINKYQRYVNTYMVTNVYCREVHYSSSCHYSDYGAITRGYQRNDYAVAHPDRTFSSRTANMATSNPAISRAAAVESVRNANDVRRLQEVSTVTGTSSTRSASAAAGRSSGGGRSTATTATGTGTGSGRSSSTSTSSSGSRSGNSTKSSSSVKSSSNSGSSRSAGSSTSRSSGSSSSRSSASSSSRSGSRSGR